MRSQIDEIFMLYLLIFIVTFDMLFRLLILCQLIHYCTYRTE